MQINVNDYVYVKLTDFGLCVHRARFDKFSEFMPDTVKYVPPKVDEDGYSKFQLHELMNLFGPVMINGGQLPFETNIKVGF